MMRIDKEFLFEEMLQVHLMNGLWIYKSSKNVDQSNGCGNSIPQRYFGRGNIHATARRICRTWQRRASMLSQKSLHGLKQSPRCWNNVFKKFMISLGFKQSVADRCIFDDRLAIVTVHVDDLVLLTETEEEMIDLKTSLANQFKTKDMGILHYCLRVSVTIKDSVLQISQEQYISKILRKYKLQDCKTVCQRQWMLASN